MEVEREAVDDDELSSSLVAPAQRRKTERVMEVAAIFIGSAEENGNVDMGMWFHALLLRCHLTLHRPRCVAPRVVFSAIEQTELTGNISNCSFSLINTEI